MWFNKIVDICMSKKNLITINQLTGKSLTRQSVIFYLLILFIATNMIKQNTRRFAKRQISWFKRDNEIKYFSANQTEEILKFIG